MLWSTKIVPLFLVLSIDWIGCAVVAGDAARRSLIIGGEETAPGEYPYYVQLLPSEFETNEDGINLGACGGTLVAPDLVLTAAGCVTDAFGAIVPPGDRLAVVGSHQRYLPQGPPSPGVEVRTCTRIAVPPDSGRLLDFGVGFDLPVSLTLAKDVALCKLNETIALDDSDVVLELNKDPAFPADDQRLSVIGLGEFFVDLNIPITERFPDALLKTEMSFLSRRRCEDIYVMLWMLEIWVPNPLTEDMICAWDPLDPRNPPDEVDFEAGVDDFGAGVDDFEATSAPSDEVDFTGVGITTSGPSYTGDVGGPLFAVSELEDGRVLHTQVGISSWGYSAGSSPWVFAGVAEVYPWIEEAACNELGSTAAFCHESPVKFSKKKVAKKAGKKAKTPKA